MLFGRYLIFYQIHVVDPPKRKRANVLPQTHHPSLPQKHKPPQSPTPPRPAKDPQLTSSTSPIPKKKRARLTKPANRVETTKANNDPSQGMCYFLDTRNREDKDQPFHADLFKKSVRTFKPPPKSRSAGETNSTRRVKPQILELADHEGENVQKYKIFKESNKFCGNIEKLDEYVESSRDNDIQTTYEERRYGESRSAKVLVRTISLLSSMQVIESHLCYNSYQNNFIANTHIFL